MSIIYLRKEVPRKSPTAVAYRAIPSHVNERPGYKANRNIYFRIMEESWSLDKPGRKQCAVKSCVFTDLVFRVFLIIIWCYTACRAERFDPRFTKRVQLAGIGGLSGLGTLIVEPDRGAAPPWHLSMQDGNAAALAGRQSQPDVAESDSCSKGCWLRNASNAHSQ